MLGRHAIILALMLAVPGMAAPRRPRPPGARLTADFYEADIVTVLKVVAKSLGRNVYIGPIGDRRLSISYRDAPPEAALQAALNKSGISYKLVDYNTLIVGTPDKIEQIESEILGRNCSEWRQRQRYIRENGLEFVLEHAASSRVVQAFAARYPEVEMVRTDSGFRALGRPSLLLKMKADLPSFDNPSPEKTKKTALSILSIHWSRREEAVRLLQTILPDLTISLDPRNESLILDGDADSVTQAEELLAQFQRRVASP